MSFTASEWKEEYQRAKQQMIDVRTKGGAQGLVSEVNGCIPWSYAALIKSRGGIEDH
jgi:hypothetical protein